MNFKDANSPPKLGGVAAPLRKNAKHPKRAQTGWFLKTRHFGIGTTPPSLPLGHPS